MFRKGMVPKCSRTSSDDYRMTELIQIFTDIKDWMIKRASHEVKQWQSSESTYFHELQFNMRFLTSDTQTVSSSA